jgi:sigma-B regulation protein RsbU (phosphoserine phosphatase)
MHIQCSTGGIVPLANASARGQPALGLFDRAQYETSSGQLAAGDVVALFTDGLYEVEGPDQQLYTSEMLQDAFRRNARLPVAELFDKVLLEVQQFSACHEFSDDVCLVGVQLTPPNA